MAPSLEPISYVRTRVSPEEVKAAWEELQSEIEILEAYEAGLTGIDGFSHLFVLTYLHEVSDEARSTMNVKPRGLLRFGLTLEELPTIGVFACDSPMRPNPIGVTVVRWAGRGVCSGSGASTRSTARPSSTSSPTGPIASSPTYESRAGTRS